MTLKKGEYYYCKTTNRTMRYDGRYMWYFDWDDVPPLDTLEEVTWGTRTIPLPEDG